jgi:beta-barrel assembly-enhancing protease
MKSTDIPHAFGSVEMSRRKFLRVASVSAAGVLAGCATNPVTGKNQLMLMSEDQEVQIDQQHSPHQFSSDYGVSQDKNLNAYVAGIGKKLAVNTHRPQMPYHFKVVNATYVNAYAFPGGSIAATRGILLNLENEAELASLLGHELGHVNARHTAEQMSKGMLTQAVVGGISVFAGTYHSSYGKMASQLGMLSAGALLASYSRDNEREADELGMSYMVKSGYNVDGFVGLMDMLQSLSKHKPNAIELMFASHPMSDERYQTAVETARTTYKNTQKAPLFKERYMDNTAQLRSMKGAIEHMQNGEKEMAKQNYEAAEVQFKKALRQAPGDYAGLVMMAKCQLAQGKYDEARRYSESAQDVYPKEAQAYHLNGFANIQEKRFRSAFQDFTTYEKLLPGNPNTSFYTGLSLEGMNRFKASANYYYRYVQSVKQGNQAAHAYQRLVQWGYVKP